MTIEVYSGNLPENLAKQFRFLRISRIGVDVENGVILSEDPTPVEVDIARQRLRGMALEMAVGKFQELGNKGDLGSYADFASNLNIIGEKAYINESFEDPEDNTERTLKGDYTVEAILYRQI